MPKFTGSDPLSNKPGRNTPCPCGSGRKFKHCHGSSEAADSKRSAIPAGFQAAAEQAFREHKAKEIVRQRQQGFGRPIISVEHSGFRLVFVGKKVCWSKRWVFFTDFLLDYLKDTLGRSWAQAAQAKGTPHPVFRWMRMIHERISVSEDTSKGIPELGYITSVFRLAYALYLIEHHDQIAPSQIKRLQNHRDEVFRPAVYETLVAAAFAVAGFEIKGAEHVRTNRKTPEFWATSKSGATYAVEAKCKLVWKSLCNADSEEFQNELRAWLRGKLYDASQKQLPSAVFWFELSIPVAFGEADYRKIREAVISTLREAENLTVDGEPTAPAYVFVTNHSHLVSDFVEGSPVFAALEGYRRPDMQSSRAVSLEEAFDIRDRHREITRVFECITEVQRVPQTFDGNPVEFMGKEGQTESSLRIGHPIQLDFPDGDTLAGVLREIAVSDDVAFVSIEDTSGKHRLASMPLTEPEIEAARQYGMAAFGKPEGPQRGLGDDPVKLYDWLLESFATYSREALLRQVHGHPSLDRIAELSLTEMRTRVAREVAKSVHATAIRSRSENSDRYES